jgi:hypothetical protein
MIKCKSPTFIIGFVMFLMGMGIGQARLVGRTGQQEEIDRVLARPIHISNLGVPRSEQVPWSTEYHRHLHPFSISRNGSLSFVGIPQAHQERWRIDLDEGTTILFAAADPD